MEKTASKSKSVRAVPEGFSTVTPYLVVDEAAKLIEFIKNAFDGKVTFITHGDDKEKIMHATVKIGDSTIMISDTMEDNKTQTSMLYLYLEDADAVYKKAIQAKATSVREPITEFYGDRAGAVKDSWGNTWWIATHVEDVSDEELKQRAAKFQREQKKQGVEAHA
jgi:PhnB protein